MVDLAGPEPMPMDELARRFLSRSGEPGPVVADAGATFFGAKVDDRSLTPACDPRVGATRFDASLKGEIKKEQAKWFRHGVQIGFPTPVADEANGMLDAVDNGAILFGIDLQTGNTLWTKKLGTMQKGAPVLADGKLYVGTENGHFFVVRPSAKGAQILSDVEMPPSKDDNAGQSAGTAEPIFAGAAVSRGRIFFVSTGGVYAIGSKAATLFSGKSFGSRKLMEPESTLIVTDSPEESAPFSSTWSSETMNTPASDER
jgi:hypothetical protein